MDWVDPLIQLVTAGGFGAFAWYLLVKYIPAKEKQHQDAVERLDDAHKEERKGWEDRYRIERAEWLAHIEKIEDRYNEYIHGKSSQS